MGKTWHNFKIEKIFSKLNSSHKGLTSKEVSQKIEQYGQNKLPEAKAESYFAIFLRQFQSPLIYILFIAGLTVLLMKEYTDGLMIFFVLIFNAIVGTIQEGKAQNTLLALKKFVETKTTVFRDGKETIIFDYELVPGDVIVLQEGEKVPADARIIKSNNLRLDEAALTGESEPVSKIADILEQKVMPIFEQKNMIFKGTHIVAGNATAIVVATGLKTAIGKITKEIATINTEIPLKTNIRYLSRLIVIAVISIGTVLFVLGLLQEKPLTEMFRTVVSLAVSIIPEGLPIVMTLILASGVWRMSKRHALVKKLQAVEALGQTKIIAVDKTGTITKNEMVVEKVFVDNKFFDVTGEGYNPQGEIKFEGKVISSQDYPELMLLGKSATFSSGANLQFSSDSQWQITGDPTEAAMLVLSQKLGLSREALEKDSSKIGEIPFDYKLRFHATVQKMNDQKMLIVAGAPEAILGLCRKVWHAGKVEGLSVLEIKKLEEIFHQMSKEGLRVVALAKTDKVPENLKPDEIQSLTFLGFLGMKDALRPEVHEAMKKANLAGIKVVMITGDHKITACAVAQEAGIYHEKDEILTGEEIDKLSDLELSEKLLKVTVFARVTPEHKLKIIRAYRQRGEVVAMTGDGVNDAPSLVAA
ncbi:MAG: HAD-IC family P-type ATPase, partial [Candidatus Berkelbacteria bacterium]|nr:HAD-IC family P-type ATPase [Candidatus Berkelbacteria bacterium]